MTNSEQRNMDASGIQNSSTQESIREWRASMETFFSEDWKKVGQIITRLEDSLWENSNAEHSDEQALSVEVSCKSQIDAMRKPRVPVSSDPAQRVRLENLAKKIEERLNHQHHA